MGIFSKKNENFIQQVGDFFKQNSCKVYYSGRDTTFKYRDNYLDLINFMKQEGVIDD